MINSNLSAVKYLSMRRRMCDASHCATCPLSLQNNGADVSCNIYEQEHIDEAMECVVSWCKKNTLTRQQWFLNMHPSASLDDAGCIEICPRYIDSSYIYSQEGYATCNASGTCVECRHAYWNKHVDENARNSSDSIDTEADAENRLGRRS